MCGKEAVPTIIHSANEINFHAAIPPSGTPACDTAIDFRPPGTPAAFISAAAFLTNPNCDSSAPNLATSSPNIKCGKKPNPDLLLIQNTGIR